MVQHVKISKSKEFIIGTEKDICYRLKKEKPEKRFFPVETAICQNMKKITLDKVLKSLESLEPEINLPENIMKNAKIPLQRMMNIGRGD
jgi:quinolinate synthase